MTLRKFIAPNLLTRSINPARVSSRFLSTDDHDSNHHKFVAIVNDHKAPYFFSDFLPWTPVSIMRCRLNAAETGILGPGCNPGRWKVRQNTEALLLQRHISGSGYEDLDVCVKPSFDPGKEPAVLIIYREIESLTFFSENEFYGRYNMRIDLQCDLYDTDAIKIAQNNKVLMISVPKLKPERINVVALKCEWGTEYNDEKMTPKKLKLNWRI